MNHRRWTLLITGKVQGVYYRASTQEKANQLNLTGFARNLPDGRVEVVAEGPEDALADLRDWCHQGPPAARVESVGTTETEATGEFRKFRTL